MLKRTIQCLALGGSALALGVVACGSPASSNPAPTTNATVSLDLLGSSGTKIGSCAGTLVAADTVLTSGHCADGVSFWQATLPSTGQTAHSSIAYTFDWDNLSTSLSHPFHHDVAVIKLDTEINLAGYPSLASGALADGAAAMRVRPGQDGSYEAVATRAYDGSAEGFGDYYYSTIDATETLETGSALLDATTNTIYGVVSSRGQTTGLLYSARVEVVSDWLATFEECTAAASIAKIVADCHPTPPPPCDGGDNSSSGGSSGASSGGTSSGTSSGSTGTSSGGTSSGTTGGSSGTTGGASSGSTGTSSGTASSGGASSGSTGGASSGGNGTTGGGDGGACGGGGGYCQGNSCGTTGSGGGGNGTTGSSSGSGGTSSGTTGGVSSGSNGGTSSGTTGGSSNGTTGGASGGGNGTTGGASGGSNGASSGGTSGGYNGASSGASGSGNGTTGGGSGGDNGCSDTSCGGCANDPNCTDNVVDYGGSPTSTPPGNDPP